MIKSLFNFFSVLTDAPSFAEPGDALLDKIAKTEVIIPCPAEGTTWVSNDSASETEQKVCDKLTDTAYNYSFQA